MSDFRAHSSSCSVNPALVEVVEDDIRRLNRERGVTFFLIEHNMSFVMELRDRIYVLDYGQLHMPRRQKPRIIPK